MNKSAASAGSPAPKNPAKKYTVGDLITGYGVAESVIHYYSIYRKSNIKNKKIIIQGWGNVAGAAAYYLSQAGGKIVGIIDQAHILGLFFPHSQCP